MAADVAKLKEKLPPARWGWQSRNVLGTHPPEQRLHLFTDGNIQPTFNPRFGEGSIGGVLLDGAGQLLGKWGRFIGKNCSNNDAEMTAILFGINHVSTIVPNPKVCGLVVHTDSAFCYRALRMNEVKAPKHVVNCLKIHTAAKGFGDYYFEKTSAENLALRAADTQAKKAFARHVKSPYKRRGAKGRSATRPAWNPFEGDGGWTL